MNNCIDELRAPIYVRLHLCISCCFYSMVSMLAIDSLFCLFFVDDLPSASIIVCNNNVYNMHGIIMMHNKILNSVY